MLPLSWATWYNTAITEKAVNTMPYAISVLLGYLLGSSSMAYYIGKWKKTDIRTAGSGNLGASNATVLLGWGAGVTVALHDIGKAVLAVLLARWLFAYALHADTAAGVSCVLGHIFPFYLKGKGGKGLASYFGMTLALNWKMALVVGVLLVLVTVVTDYISLAAICMVILVPIYAWAILHDPVMAGILTVATLVMLVKHRENIVRIARGQEIGLRSTAKGENRMDSSK